MDFGGYSEKAEVIYIESIGFAFLMIVLVSDIYIMKVLMHQPLNCLRKEEGIFAITQHLATWSLHVKKLYVFNAADEYLRFKSSAFLVNHYPEFLAFTAEDESNQSNRMRVNGLVFHCSSAFLHSFSDHSVTFLIFLSVQPGKYLQFFCQGRL